MPSVENETCPGGCRLILEADDTMDPRQLLIEPLEFLAPPRILEDLASEVAERRVDGANHSIAELVAHLAFWQQWFLQRCQGVAEPMVQHAAAGWPAVAAGTWPAVRDSYVKGLTALTEWAEAAAGRLEHPVEPAIKFPPLAAYTVRDALVHVANHNAHHLGQVVLLRQLLGAWPPPAGSWTW
jgi:uncharacterized damage-inducible protein DinB